MAKMKKGTEAEAQGKAPPERWRGDAVEDRPGDQAERAADRAEGNAPVPANAEREKIQEPPEPDQQPLRVQPGSEEAGDPEEEIQEVAEEHRERRNAGERPPRGKL
jgi:hypothetical protein